MRKAELSSQVFVLLHVVKRIGSMEGRRKVNSESKLVNSGLIGESSPMQLLARRLRTVLVQLLKLSLRITQEIWSGRRGSNPALNVCAPYGVCRNLNI
jgi:hypothetical protein